MGGARVLRGRRGQRPRGSWIASRCASFDIRQNPRLEYARRHVDQVGLAQPIDHERPPFLGEGDGNDRPIAILFEVAEQAVAAERGRSMLQRDCRKPFERKHEPAVTGRGYAPPAGSDLCCVLYDAPRAGGRRGTVGEMGQGLSSQLKTMSWVRVPGGRIATIPPRRHILLSATRLIQLEQSAEYVLLGGLAISRIGILGLQTICQGLGPSVCSNDGSVQLSMRIAEPGRPLVVEVCKRALL